MLPFCTYQTILNVLIDRIVEKKGFLLNKPYLGSPPFEINFMQIFPTNGDCTISKEERL
jgi:hypothetical protein